MRNVNKSQIQSAIHDILSGIGEDVNREGILDTPKRVVKSFEFLTQGYDQDANEILSSALFKEKYDQMIIIRDIQFFFYL